MQELGTRFHYDHSFMLQSVRLGRWELYQIGERCLEPTSAVSGHQQSCYEISYIISGKGRFEQDGSVMDVKEGDLIFSPQCGMHAIYAAEDSQLHYAYVGFKTVSQDDTVLNGYNLFFSQENQVLRCGTGSIYRCFRHCIDEFYRRQPTDFLMVEACLTRLIISCYRVFTSNISETDYTVRIQNLGQLLYRVIKFIDQNSYLPLSVSNVAKGVGYSSFYLSHVFKEKMGVTLQQYISDCRIERAKELIALKRFTITEISEQLGFLNLQTFSRTFKHKTGKSPSEYINTLK